MTTARWPRYLPGKGRRCFRMKKIKVRKNSNYLGTLLG